ncbi:MAG: FkbM family methyltransferase [Planctomycetota bacterium]
MPDESAAPAFGTHAPSAPVRWLRLLTRLGLARGVIGRAMRKAWIRYSDHPIDIEVRGVRYRLDIRDNPTDGRLLVSSLVYDRREIDALATAPPSPPGETRTFIDAGANVGYYGLALARRGFDRVIAIEPNPPTLARLRFNIQSNAWRDRFTVVPCCIGEGGEVDFHTAGSLGNAGIREAGDEPGHTIRVPSRPLLNIVREAGATRIDALKIDVEGYEDRCLIPFFAEAPRELWPAVMVLEYIGGDEWQVDLVGHLKALGYRERLRTRSNVIFERAAD